MTVEELSFFEETHGLAGACIKPRNFAGETYDKKQDQKRLSSQYQIVFNLMADGRWRTLGEVREITGFPEASISARFRDMRAPANGGYTVEHRRKKESKGTYEYKLWISTGRKTA